MAENFNNLTYVDGGVTFTVPNPTKGFTRKSEPRVSKIQFGDGYSQRLAAGINTLKEVWSLNWENIPIAAVDAVSLFLETRGGVEHFLWTPAGTSIQYKVICSTWDRTYNSHIANSIKCDFERVYDIL